LQLAVEAISNIRTVAGLGREKTFVERYIAELSGPHETAKRKAHVRGLVFGFAQVRTSKNKILAKLGAML
jgi:hypothetical protein